MKSNKIVQEQKLAKHNVLHSKIAKIITLSLACLSLIVAGFGIYSLKKNDINPSEGVSENLTTSAEIVKDLPNERIKIGNNLTVEHLSSLDENHNNAPCHRIAVREDIRNIEGKPSVSRISFDIYIYERDCDARYNSISCSYSTGSEKSKLYLYTRFASVDGKSSTLVGANAEYRYTKWLTIGASINAPLSVDNYKINFPYMDLSIDAKIQPIKYVTTTIHLEDTAKEGSLWYDLMQNVIDYIYPTITVAVNEVLYALNATIDFPYTSIDDFQSDLNKVTGTRVANTEIGSISLLIALPVFFLALILLIAPFVFNRVHKTEKATVTTSGKLVMPNGKKTVASTMKLATNKTGAKVSSFNSITLGTFIIAIISLSVITANIVVGFKLNYDNLFASADTINVVSKNLLNVGLTFLAFFGCIYVSKKDKNAIKPVLIGTFIAGVFCYLFNILSYQYLIPHRDIYSEYLIVDTFLQTVPDNIFIPLFLALLAHYYSSNKTSQNNSFTAIKNLIPVLAVAVLIASCFIGPITSTMTKSYYLTALFSPNLSIAGFFTASYLIVTYIVSNLTYKHSNASYNTHLNSSENIKNNKIIATAIISLLFIIDLICRFYATGNMFNFGYNHGIILLIPFIWLYKVDSNQKEANINPLMICLIALIILGSVSVLTQSVHAVMNIPEGL